MTNKNKPNSNKNRVSSGTRADPTANVIANLETAIRRQDDLRENDTAHLKELMELHAHYEDILRIKESERIDAIRSVDVAAVASAAKDSSQVAATLATQVATSADALRNQVEITKTATAAALSAALEPIQKDVSELRRIQYEQAGQKSANTEQRDDKRVTFSQMMGIGALVGSFGSIITSIIVFH